MMTTMLMTAPVGWLVGSPPTPTHLSRWPQFSSSHAPQRPTHDTLHIPVYFNLGGGTVCMFQFGRGQDGRASNVYLNMGAGGLGRAHTHSHMSITHICLLTLVCPCAPVPAHAVGRGGKGESCWL